jgi:hypothetical protein
MPNKTTVEVKHQFSRYMIGFLVVVIISTWAFISFYLFGYEGPKDMKSPQEIAMSGPIYSQEATYKLPKGWHLQYASLTDKFRWCDDKGYCSIFDADTPEEATKKAWSMYKQRKLEESTTWEDFR